MKKWKDNQTRSVVHNVKSEGIFVSFINKNGGTGKMLRRSFEKNYQLVKE